MYKKQRKEKNPICIDQLIKSKAKAFNPELGTNGFIIHLDNGNKMATSCQNLEEFCEELDVDLN